MKLFVYHEDLCWARILNLWLEVPERNLEFRRSLGAAFSGRVLGDEKIVVAISKLTSGCWFYLYSGWNFTSNSNYYKWRDMYDQRCTCISTTQLGTATHVEPLCSAWVSDKALFHWFLKLPVKISGNSGKNLFLWMVPTNWGITANSLSLAPLAPIFEIVGPGSPPRISGQNVKVWYCPRKISTDQFHTRQIGSIQIFHYWN